MRKCDGCTVCCYVTEIQEISKPANSLCSKCNVKVGCDVYDQRPESCRRYECAWLTGEIENENMRPDKCGVIFERYPGVDALMGFSDPGNPKVWRQKAVMDELMVMLSRGKPVVIREGLGETWHAIVPNGADAGRIIEQVKNSAVERMKWQRLHTDQT